MMEAKIYVFSDFVFIDYKFKTVRFDWFLKRSKILLQIRTAI